MHSVAWLQVAECVCACGTSETTGKLSQASTMQLPSFAMHCRPRQCP